MDFKQGDALNQMLGAPFIYAVFFPVVLLDIFVEVYHRICFALYGLDYVDRTKYIRIDRHRLEYLTWVEKINCAYCGYVNGFFAYATEIAARTEQYWCGIKHEKRRNAFEQHHHKNWPAYGDEKAFRKRYEHKE